MIVAPSLPYPEDALEPLLSARTVHFHRAKQERYVRRTNDLVRGTLFDGMPLSIVVDECARAIDEEEDPSSWLTDLFEQSSQALNHAQMWVSMRPPVLGRRPDLPELAHVVGVPLTMMETLRDQWKAASASVFASGWVWLLVNNGALKVEATENADRPSRGRPVLVMDVWEHAYYLDYPDAKAKYVDAWFDDLADWSRLRRRELL